MAKKQEYTFKYGMTEGRAREVAAFLTRRFGCKATVRPWRNGLYSVRTTFLRGGNEGD